MVEVCSLSELGYCMSRFLVLVLIYGSETMIWKKKERSSIRALQMDNLRFLLGIRRKDSPECTDKGVVRSDERVGRKD